MSSAAPVGELILLPSLRALRRPDGALLVTKKYLDGALAYARHWPGPVTSLFRIADSRSWDMDLTEVPDGGPHQIEVRPESTAELQARLLNAALVFPALTPFEKDTVDICRGLGVPVVLGTEYSLDTEHQIIDAETRNPLLRWRRKRWANWAERVRLDMLTKASGLQCSGTPTYDAYRDHNADPILFFDNRVPFADVIRGPELAQKRAAILDDRPLRLVFGGRLIAMKGVLDLPEVAAELRRLGIKFRMEIYGQGDLELPLRLRIGELGLESQIALRGVMDFRNEWIPMLKASADLFVCCHPQGDPSSTYPEVMSCGVAIAGYGNEAFSGVIRESGSGWSSPVGNVHALAQRIAFLAANRSEIARHSVLAADFARQHAFEVTFARRAEHLIRCSSLPDELKRQSIA